MNPPEDPPALAEAKTAGAVYPLLRLEIDVPEALAQAAVGAAWRLGAQGVAIRDGGTGDAPPGRAVICSWMPADDADGVLRAAEQCLGDLRAVAGLRLVPEDPRAWRAHLGDAIAVGGFTIVSDLPESAGAPTGAPRAASETHRLLIEPGSAFGGGTHPTTALCIRAIEARFASPAPPHRVLDVGTGTGILALVAATLGGQVHATDIDPLARQAARRHADLNGLGERITIGAALPDGAFGLIVANLYLGPLCALAPELARRLAPGGRCIVSGITPAHRPTVEGAFAAVALHPVGAVEADGWVALAMARAAPGEQTLDPQAPGQQSPDPCTADRDLRGDRSHPDPESP